MNWFTEPLPSAARPATPWAELDACVARGLNSLQTLPQEVQALAIRMPGDNWHLATPAGNADEAVHAKKLLDAVTGRYTAHALRNTKLKAEEAGFTATEVPDGPDYLLLFKRNPAGVTPA